MILSEERYFQFSTRVIPGVEALQNFVEPLKNESPEADKRSEVADAVGNISSVVVVWFHNFRTIQLQEYEIKARPLEWDDRPQRAECNKTGLGLPPCRHQRR
jgi:hypothetical protein